MNGFNVKRGILLFAVIMFSIFLGAATTSRLMGHDTEAPVIEMNDDFLTTYGVNSAEPNWLDAVTEVTDNKTIVSITDVEITSDFNMDTVGTYEVIYTLVDSKDNKCTEKITVTIVDTTKPTITLTATFPTLYIKSAEEPDWSDAIEQVLDDNDSLSISDVVIDTSEVDMDTNGTFDVTYTLTDNNGNGTIEVLTIEIGFSVDLTTLANGRSSSFGFMEKTNTGEMIALLRFYDESTHLGEHVLLKISKEGTIEWTTTLPETLYFDGSKSFLGENYIALYVRDLTGRYPGISSYNLTDGDFVGTKMSEEMFADIFISDLYPNGDVFISIVDAYMNEAKQGDIWNITKEGAFEYKYENMLIAPNMFGQALYGTNDSNWFIFENTEQDITEVHHYAADGTEDYYYAVPEFLNALRDLPNFNYIDDNTYYYISKESETHNKVIHIVDMNTNTETTQQSYLLYRDKYYNETILVDEEHTGYFNIEYNSDDLDHVVFTTWEGVKNTVFDGEIISFETYEHGYVLVCSSLEQEELIVMNTEGTLMYQDTFDENELSYLRMIRNTEILRIITTENEEENLVEVNLETGIVYIPTLESVNDSATIVQFGYTIFQELYIDSENSLYTFTYEFVNLEDPTIRFTIALPPSSDGAVFLNESENAMYFYEHNFSTQLATIYKYSKITGELLYSTEFSSSTELSESDEFDVVEFPDGSLLVGRVEKDSSIGFYLDNEGTFQGHLTTGITYRENSGIDYYFFGLLGTESNSIYSTYMYVSVENDTVKAVELTDRSTTSFNYNSVVIDFNDMNVELFHSRGNQFFTLNTIDNMNLTTYTYMYVDGDCLLLVTDTVSDTVILKTTSKEMEQTYKYYEIEEEIQVRFYRRIS